MKGRHIWLGVGALLTGLLGIAGAGGGGTELYGGTYTTGEDVKVEVYSKAGTALRLEEVSDPFRLLSASKSPHQPVIPAGLPTRLVRTVTTGKGDTLNLGKLPSGVYLLREGKSASVIMVTRLGLIVKRDDKTALVYAADRQTGQPREAQVWALRGTPGAPPTAQESQRTSGSLARFASTPKANPVLLARSGNDWAISDSSWNSYAAPNWVGHVYSDRPIFRPGQHVDLKGVVRVPGSLKPLAGRAVRLRVTNEDGDEVFSRRLTTNAYGSVSAGFDLSAGARLGSYEVELRPEGAGPDDDLPRGRFAVQEYQKPEYEVMVAPERRSAVQGETVKVKISAKYLFGGVPGGAKVNYNITRARYYSPYYDAAAELPDDEGRDYGSDLVKQGKGRLSAAGDLVVDVPLARDADGNPMSYRIEAEVEDETRKTVSAQSRVIAFPAALTVDAGVDGYVFTPGQAMTVKLDTRTLENQGRAAPVTLELVRYDWVKQNGKWQEKVTTVSRQQTTTGASGQLDVKLKAPSSGGYVVRATVKDPQGRAAQSENFVWVAAAGEDWNWYSRDITVRMNRKQYAPGDTATVLVNNPVPGAPVLLTLEGDRLRGQTVLRGQGSVLTYTFKVKADMSPNIHVGAAVLGGGQTYTGEAEVVVPHPDSALNVQVTPGKTRYAPGEKGQLRVQVTNARGQGVGAELSFGVVDKAIYLIQRDDAPTLSQVFLARRDNVVGTESSTRFDFEPIGTDTANRPRAPMSAAAFAQSKAEADQGSFSDVPVRENFKDTLVWLPQLVTDERGQASVDVTFPDNLTTWVTTARAQSKEPRFGQSVTETQVTKDVIARLSLPAFLVRGDQSTLGAVINNTLPTAVKGTAQVALQGLTGLSGAALAQGGAAVQVAAQGRALQDVKVQATDVGQASVTFTARTAQGSDALKLPLPVKARGYAENLHVVGRAGEPGRTFTLPQGVNPQTVRLSLSATPSLLSAVAPALEYLVGYPYGCTEQTMSRFLPALLAKQTLGNQNLPPEVVRDLPDIVATGLARLAKFQHEDGGWNFWENDRSTLEMSAYVTEGLLRAKSAGASVDARMLSRALAYLGKRAADSKERGEDRARALKVLSQAAQPNLNLLSSFAAKPGLSSYALAQTALAQQKAGQSAAARQTLERLKAARQAGKGLVHWSSPQREDDWFRYWDDNDIQVTAAALEALAAIEPKSPLMTPASQWLLQQRRGPRWVSTQDTTSVVIAALALPKVAAPSAETAVRVQLDGKDAGQVKLSGKEGSLELSPGLGAGQHTLNVVGALAGLTYAAEVTYSREPAQLSGAGDDFALARKYERLTPTWDAKNERYTYQRQNLLSGGQMTPVKVGDLVLVTLSVKPKQGSARYLLVSDPIPAGMKALDERSLAIAGLPAAEDNWWEWNYWYSGRELRDDRVDLYANYLSGQQTMTYVLRAQTPGTFTALPTHAFLMYDDRVESYGPAATLTVQDRK